MQIVDSVLRPFRFAVCFSPQATSRSLRRAFRLVGGRWGGAADLLLCVDPDDLFDPFVLTLLRKGDPDYLASVDPRLTDGDMDKLAERADIQPFALGRIPEGFERDVEWLFEDSATVTDDDAEETAVIDVERSGFSWRTAAVQGLLPKALQLNRVKPGTAGATTPAARSMEYLTPPPTDVRWLLFGNTDDVRLAATYWSLRALGGRPAWRPMSALSGEWPEGVARRVPTVLYSREASQDELEAAAERWTTTGASIKAAPTNTSGLFRSETFAFLARQSVPVQPHNEWLRFSTPAVPPLGKPLRPSILAVAHHRVLSPDQGDPDGLILARDPTSTRLIQPGSLLDRRPTTDGFAEPVPLDVGRLIQLPLVQYTAAVAAPFENAGFSVSPSDKGVYQQRVLHLAGGLLFLAWILRNADSAHLLDLFFEYPGTGAPPSRYRRAVRFDELQTRLYLRVRGDRKRLRQGLRTRADDWLRDWLTLLLERNLLIAGYLLHCDHCRGTDWYVSERVDQSFICSRCGAKNVAPADTRRSFHLNDAFYLLREQGGQVVTLALATLRKNSLFSFLYLPETSIDTGSLREVDIAALVDGELVLVEAKSNDQLTKRDVDKYVFLARRAHAKRIIFATSASASNDCLGEDCGACVETNGEFHADLAWSAGARVRIEAAREALRPHGISVESWCHHHLVGRHSSQPLERFVRRPAPRPGQLLS